MRKEVDLLSWKYPLLIELRQVKRKSLVKYTKHHLRLECLQIEPTLISEFLI